VLRVAVMCGATMQLCNLRLPRCTDRQMLAGRILHSTMTLKHYYYLPSCTVAFVSQSALCALSAL
jgi:hypothetical protein